MLRRTMLLGFLVLLFTGLVAPQSVAADHVSDVYTIPYDNYLYYSVDYTYGGTLSITASVGTYDSNIDLYIMYPSEYTNYKSGSGNFRYITACSDEDTYSADIYCSLDAGKYYIVFDNMIMTGAYPYDGESVTVTYSIDTVDNSSNGGNGGGSSDFLGSILCFAIGGVVLVVIVVVVVVSLKKRRTASGAPLPRSGAGTYAPPPSPPPSRPVQPQRSPDHGHHYQASQPEHHYEPPPPDAYEPPPPPPAQPAPEPARAAEPGEPPALELPGMMGGTRGTLDDTYSAPPKPRDKDDLIK